MLTQDNCAGLSQFAQAKGWLRPDQQIMALSKPGDGNMNRVLRAQLDDGHSLVFKQALPYVAKYPDIPAPEHRLEVEYGFYQALKPFTSLHQRTPNIIGFDAETHILCMQDLGMAEDYTSLYGTATWPDSAHEHITELISWLSALHALPVSNITPRPNDNLDMRVLNHEHIFNLPFVQDNGLTFSDAMTEARRDLLNDDATAIAARLGRLYLGTGPVSDDHPLSLLHGDFHPASWLNDEHGSVRVIDAEFSFIGAPEFDVGVMQAHLSMSGLADREIKQLFSQHYAPVAAFKPDLCQQFAAIEVLRRLWGVAKLPLMASESTQVTMATHAMHALTTACSS